MGLAVGVKNNVLHIARSSLELHTCTWFILIHPSFPQWPAQVSRIHCWLFEISFVPSKINSSKYKGAVEKNTLNVHLKVTLVRLSFLGQPAKGEKSLLQATGPLVRHHSTKKSLPFHLSQSFFYQRFPLCCSGSPEPSTTTTRQSCHSNRLYCFSTSLQFFFFNDI